MNEEKNLFWKTELSSVIEGHRVKMLAQIDALQPNQLLSADLEEVAAHYIGEYTIPPLELHDDQLELIEPREITVEEYSRDRGRNYTRKKLEFRFEIPFSGEADLGFKVRRRGAPPATVTFPVTRKSVVPPLSVAKPGPIAKPDPALEMAAYEDILGNLAGMSIAIERSPSTFANIGEEALRDWFLVALNGNFRGDATGETFNREGKTDISIRVNGGVIFIAECKFWGGEKILLETIDQLLGYLTWRDSKAAILVFSRNADFTAVLQQIPDIARKHPHLRGPVAVHGESGFRFRLRDKTDPAREHLVTFLAFNMPRAAQP